MKLRLLIGLLLIFFYACAQNPKNTPSNDYQIPKPVGYVNDYEKNFNIGQQDSLSSLIKAFEIETGIEIALATFDTTMVAKNEFLDFTLAVAKNWGVGKKHENNGILIVFLKVID